MARAGDTLRALEAFRALAAANPNDFDSGVWLGRLLTRVGRRAEAIDLLQDVITRSPRQVDARVALGAALLTSGRVEDAYAVVQDAEALEPNSAESLRSRAASCGTSGVRARRTCAGRGPRAQPARRGHQRRSRADAPHDRAPRPRQPRPGGVRGDSRSDDRGRRRRPPSRRHGARVRPRPVAGRAGFDDARGGGGVEWRLSRRVVGRGALLDLAGLAAPRARRRRRRGRVRGGAHADDVRPALSRLRRCAGVDHRVPRSAST